MTEPVSWLETEFEEAWQRSGRKHRVKTNEGHVLWHFSLPFTSLVENEEYHAGGAMMGLKNDDETWCYEYARFDEPEFVFWDGESLNGSMTVRYEDETKR